jgi:hypothetical protein
MKNLKKELDERLLRRIRALHLPKRKEHEMAACRKGTWKAAVKPDPVPAKRKSALTIETPGTERHPVQSDNFI